MKRFLSLKTLVLIIIGIGTMLTCYQHLSLRFDMQLSYLILEGPFAVFSQVVSENNSQIIPSVLMIIIIISFIESPVINQDDRFFIMRAGKIKWIASEITGIICASFIWIILINIMGCISSFNNMDWTDWKIYPGNFRCMLIYFLAYNCIGLSILMFHMLDIKALGTAIIVTLFLFEKVMLDLLPNTISIFSEKADTGHILSVVSEFAFINRMENGYSMDNIVFSIIYFAIIMTAITGIIVAYARKHEVG